LAPQKLVPVITWKFHSSVGATSTLLDKKEILYALKVEELIVGLS